MPCLPVGMDGNFVKTSVCLAAKKRSIDEKPSSKLVLHPLSVCSPHFMSLFGYIIPSTLVQAQEAHHGGGRVSSAAIGRG